MKKFIYRLFCKLGYKDEAIYQYLKVREQEEWDYFCKCKSEYEDTKRYSKNEIEIMCAREKSIHAQNYWNDVYDERNRYARLLNHKIERRDF